MTNETVSQTPQASDEYIRGFDSCKAMCERIVDEHDGYLDRIGHLDAVTSYSEHALPVEAASEAQPFQKSTVSEIEAAPASKVEMSEAQPLERDWEEDFSHENGNYLNTCYLCNETFSGHKRRAVCKLCAALEPQREEEPCHVDPRIYANPQYLEGLHRRVTSAFCDQDFKAVKRLFEAEIEEMEKRIPTPTPSDMPVALVSDSRLEELKLYFEQESSTGSVVCLELQQWRKFGAGLKGEK